MVSVMWTWKRKGRNEGECYEIALSVSFVDEVASVAAGMI